MTTKHKFDPKRKRIVLIIRNAGKKYVSWWDWFASSTSPRWQLSAEDIKAVIRSAPIGALGYLLAVALREAVAYFASGMESGSAGIGDYLLMLFIMFASMLVNLLRKWAGAVGSPRERS